MQMRDILPRPGGPALLVGLALSFTALTPLAARAQQSPAVETLERALKNDLPPSDLADEYAAALKERAKTLKQLTDDKSELQSLSDITQALLLQDWGDDRTYGGDSPDAARAVDRTVREALVLRYLNGVKKAIKSSEEANVPVLRAAVATQVGEYGVSALSGFLGARKIHRLLLDDMPWFTAVIAGLAENDKSPEVRAAAAGALARLQSDPTKENSPRNDDLEVPITLPLTVPALQTMLKDPNVKVRRAAATALGDLLRGSRPADRTVTATTINTEDPQRKNLYDFGPQVARAAGAVLKDHESDTEVRRLAASALLQVGTQLNGRLRAGDRTGRGQLRR